MCINVCWFWPDVLCQIHISQQKGDFKNLPPPSIADLRSRNGNATLNFGYITPKITVRRISGWW